MRFKEKWMNVRGHPSYEVSNIGNVRNKNTGHIKALRLTADGYKQVSLNTGGHGKSKSYLVHRLVADHFHEGDHSGLQVNHIDGDKQNNRVDNLEWCTGSQNVQHAYDNTLRRPSGGRGPISKIKIVETGEVFDNMAECAKAVNGDSGNICHVADKTHLTYHGYHYIRVKE